MKCNYKSCFFYLGYTDEFGHNCPFKRLCHKSYENYGFYRYYLKPYEARRMLIDIFLDMDRFLNQNDKGFYHNYFKREDEK